MVLHVAVTGGAGQIAYSLLFRIANGEMFGPDQKVALHILEVPEALGALEGVVMELHDCAFPLLTEVVTGSDPKQVFKGVQWALLVGAKPRGPGMERGDLLRDNGKIFIGQGQALNEVADKDVRVVVVGNPCNTNAWIVTQNAPNIPKGNITAMTRLDENRAAAQLALKADVALEEVSGVVVWGNHSATQVPDFTHATIKGKAAQEVIGDRSWLEGEFFETVQKRGAAIIKARGKSSAASAANGVIDHVKALLTPTPKGSYFSCSVHTLGNRYGLDEDLIFSLPCTSRGDGSYQVVDGLDWDSFITDKVKKTEEELKSEREEVR